MFNIENKEQLLSANWYLEVRDNLGPIGNRETLLMGRYRHWKKAHVTPAKAGVQPSRPNDAFSVSRYRTDLDSGLRRNDRGVLLRGVLLSVPEAYLPQSAL